jgi:hypothetical protein
VGWWSKKVLSSFPSVTMHSKQNLWYKIDDMFINKEFMIMYMKNMNCLLFFI